MKPERILALMLPKILEVLQAGGPKHGDRFLNAPVEHYVGAGIHHAGQALRGQRRDAVTGLHPLWHAAVRLALAALAEDLRGK